VLRFHLKISQTVNTQYLVIAEFLAEFTSEDSWGDDGYLTEKGLIPLSEEKRAEVAKGAKELTPLSL